MTVELEEVGTTHEMTVGGGLAEKRSMLWSNSLLFLRLLEDKGDELLDQQDEDKEPNDPTHNGQDDKCHRVVHFFHYMSQPGEKEEKKGNKSHLEPSTM